MAPTSDDFSTIDRKSTRLNSSHSQISYAVFCLKKKIEDDVALGVLLPAAESVEHRPHGHGGVDLLRLADAHRNAGLVLDHLPVLSDVLPGFRLAPHLVEEVLAAVDRVGHEHVGEAAVPLGLRG